MTIADYYYVVEPEYFDAGALIYTDGESLSSFLNYTTYPCTIVMKEKTQ
jgi:hypothetical protein